MEIVYIDFVYAFIVAWNDTSRGVFLTEHFASLDECMLHLQSWSYDPNLLNLECVKITD